ncbi:MAG: hypothetical protein HY518_02155, partial [Candidatus Aenigmarchaeota archaeon]|nr:hypothetical protein [Candidatus Aenigmarchaeota archaeon]
NTLPTYQNVSSNPWTGGFGETFNFSLETRDADGEDVTTLLYLSNDNSTWTLQETKTCLGCINFTVIHFNYTQYACANISQQYFRFNLSDDRNTTTVPGQNITVERDDTSTILSFGNVSSVNRSLSNTTLLILRVNDTDARSPVGANVSVSLWVTTDGSSFLNVTGRVTNSSGYFNLTFNPDCSFSVGLQKWKGGVNGDACYKDANSTNMDVTVVGDLINILFTPNSSSKFLEGQNVSFRGNVTDECFVAVDGATVFFTVNHTDRLFSNFSVAYPGPAREEAAAVYNASLNVSGSAGGNYNVTFNSSKANYNPRELMAINAYFHQIAPFLTNQTVDAINRPWGTQYNFTINVTDVDDNVTLRFWDSTDNNAFTQRGSSQTCSSCINNTITFSRTYSLPSDISVWYWKINATDTNNLSAEISSSTINVTRRNVTFTHNFGNNSLVSRFGSNTSTLEVRIFDAYSGTALNGYDAGIFVTIDGLNFTNVLSGTTDPDGDITSTFNPSCSNPRFEVGVQRWTAEFRETGTNDDYFPANSSNFTLTINSTFILNITHPQGEAYHRSTSVNIRGNVTDLDATCGGVTGATVNLVTKGTIASCTPDPANELGSGSYNCTFDTSSEGLNYYNITMNTSASFYVGTNITKTNAFQVRERPRLTNPVTDTTTDGWGHNYTFNITVRDIDSGDTANVTLWRSFDGQSFTAIETKQCAGCTSETVVQFYYNQFACSDIASGPNITFKFNATDTYTLTNTTNNQNITLESDDVAIIYVSGQGTSVNREGSEAVQFVVRINDTDRGTNVSGSVNGTFWVTTNGVAFDAGTDNFTNSSGYLNIFFNPSCSYSAGTQFWKAGTNKDACYKPLNLSSSQSFSVTGQLKVSLLEPPENSYYNSTNLININFTIPTDCPVQDGNQTSVTNLLNLTHSGGTSYSCSPITESGGFYNCTFNTTGKLEGNYSANISATKTNYNSNTSIFSNRFVIANFNTTAQNLSVVPNSSGWTAKFNFSIDINDPEADNVTCVLFTSTDNQASFQNKGNTTIPG